MHNSADPRGGYDYEHAYGGMSLQAYADDPKRLAFTLARYKHTAKILEGRGRVLEVGCADGFGSRIVRQHVGSLAAIDPDRRSIDEAHKREAASRAAGGKWPVSFYYGELSVSEVREWQCTGQTFDAVYALDVLEHIRPDDDFLAAMKMAAPVAVIGTPSAESQVYASAPSRAGHVNCYSGADLRARLLKYWDHVFIFTMHDETLGTSFSPMAHYLLALCVRGDNGK